MTQHRCRQPGIANLQNLINPSITPAGAKEIFLPQFSGDTVGLAEENRNTQRILLPAVCGECCPEDTPPMRKCRQHSRFHVVDFLAVESSKPLFDLLALLLIMQICKVEYYTR